MIYSVIFSYDVNIIIMEKKNIVSLEGGWEYFGVGLF